MSTRILIADDHQVLLDGLESMLKEVEGIEVKGQCADGNQVIGYLSKEEVDLVLLDINMPGMNGIEAMEKIQKDHPQVKVIALSMYKQPSYINRMLRLGAQGYVLKDEGKDEIVKAIRVCAGGDRFLSREISKILHDQKSKLPVNLGITSREKQILVELAKGLTSKEISEQLHISYHTVRTHRKHLLQKFDVGNVTSLISRAKNMGMI